METKQLMVRDCIRMDLFGAMDPEVLNLEADCHVGHAVVVLAAQIQAVVEIGRAHV
jgi:hypothetical protein